MYIFYPHFESQKGFFSRRFFQKILRLCMVSIQERFVIKSGLWWRMVISKFVSPIVFFFSFPACLSKLCFWELYVTYVANVKEEKLAVVMQSRNLSSKAWRSLYGIMVHPTPFGRRKTKSKGREFSGKPESLFMLTFHNFFCRKYCNKDISKIPKTKVFDKHFPKM